MTPEEVAAHNAYWDAEEERDEHEHRFGHDTREMLDDAGEPVGWCCDVCDWTVSYREEKRLTGDAGEG